MIPDFDLDSDLAVGLRDALANFNNPAGVTNFRRAKPIERTPGLVVALAVRTGRLKPDETFEHQSGSISKLQARIEAEQAARARGYIVGYVIDYKTGEGS